MCASSLVVSKTKKFLACSVSRKEAVKDARSLRRALSRLHSAYTSIGRCDFSAEESLRSGAADTGSCLSMPTPVTGKARAKRSRTPQRDGTPYHSAAASAASSSTAAVTTTNIAVTAALEEAEPPDSSVAASDTLLGEGGAAAGGKPGRESRKLKQPNGKVAPARHRLC